MAKKVSGKEMIFCKRPTFFWTSCEQKK